MYIYIISLLELFYEFIKQIHPQLDDDFYKENK